MVTLDTAQWSAWIGQLFWPFIRLLALFASAPLFGEKAIPARAKVGIALAATLLLAPALPPVDVPPVSGAGLWLAVQQLIIGVALGLTMQFAFAAVRLSGEIIGLQMGLSFAVFFDPGGGPNMPILSRLFNLLALLLFLSFDGHLWLISLLADSFHTLPISDRPLNGDGFLRLAQSGGLIFINGLMLALPLITLLLTLSAALALLNRVTPQLSIFVVGFPLTLTVGILTIGMMMPMLAPFCEHLFSEIFERLAGVISGMA